MEHKPSSVRLQKNAQRPSYETAVAKIISLIRNEGIQPGDRLPPERVLSEHLNVSRTVVREAIRALTATGIVYSIQGSGIYLQKEPQPMATTAIDLPMAIEPKDIDSLFEFRMTLEEKTASLAAERITLKELRQLEEHVRAGIHYAEQGDNDASGDCDFAFHRGIAEAARNPFFISTISTVFRLQNWAVHVMIGQAPNSLVLAGHQHEGILATLREGDADSARQCMREHIETVLNNYHLALRRLLVNESGVEIKIPGE